MILAIDGSTTWCCIAVANGETVLAEKGWLTSRGHTTDLTAEIDTTLKQIGTVPGQLQAVAVALGPGSFSGLRAAMAVAKGIAFALHIPLVGVPTMEAMAALAYPSASPVWCIIQLGRGRAVGARYRVDSLPPLRLSPYNVYTKGKTSPLVAPGERVVGDWAAVLDPEALKGPVAALPWWGVRHCAALAYLGELKLRTSGPDDLTALEPIYVSGPAAPGSAQL